MKNKKNSPLPLLALIFALAALLLSVLALSGIPEDQSHLIDDLYAENHRLQQRVESLEAQLDQLMAAVSLRSWTLDVLPWPDSTGADVTLTASPSGYQTGVSATFLVMLEGKQIQSIPCLWNGTDFTATASLNAADGYSYFLLLSAPSGTQQLPLMNAADSPNMDIAGNLASSLSAYCNLAIHDWAESSGTTLILTDAYAQVQLPQLRAQELTIASQKLVLRLNGAVSDQVPIEMVPSEVAGSFELVIQDLSVSMPQLNGGDNLELYLEITLSDGSSLQAQGISWYLENGKLCSSVG